MINRLYYFINAYFLNVSNIFTYTYRTYSPYRNFGDFEFGIFVFNSKDVTYMIERLYISVKNNS